MNEVCGICHRPRKNLRNRYDGFGRPIKMCEDCVKRLRDEDALPQHKVTKP